MSLFWHILAILGTFLQLLVIGRMQRRGAYRTYPLLFSYCVLLFLVGIAEWAVVLEWSPVRFSRETYAVYYWTNEVILQFAIFCVMIRLIWQAMRGVPSRRVLLAGIVVALPAAVGLAAFFRGQAPFSRYMTAVSRNLSFLTALLNLVLWSALLRSRERDTQRLQVAAGIGLLTTGKAVGHSLRVMARSPTMVGNFIVVASHLLCLLIWWRAFRRAEQPVTAPGRVF